MSKRYGKKEGIKNACGYCGKKKRIYGRNKQNSEVLYKCVNPKCNGGDITYSNVTEEGGGITESEL